MMWRIVPAGTIGATSTLTTPSRKWLADAHEALVATVAAAYGWSTDISYDAVLGELLALNSDRR